MKYIIVGLSLLLAGPVTADLMDKMDQACREERADQQAGILFGHKCYDAMTAAINSLDPYSPIAPLGQPGHYVRGIGYLPAETSVTSVHRVGVSGYANPRPSFIILENGE